MIENRIVADGHRTCPVDRDGSTRIKSPCRVHERVAAHVDVFRGIKSTGGVHLMANVDQRNPRDKQSGIATRDTCVMVVVDFDVDGIDRENTAICRC